MKVNCQKQDLIEAVLNIQRAVSAKSSVPALEGILLKASGSEIFLCGYDLELGITTAIPSKVLESGSVILNARLFGNIVRRLPSSDVYISLDEKNLTTITSSFSEFSIAGIPAEEYPELPVVADVFSFALSQSVLKSMIRQTLFAIADTDNRPIHTGTLFELTDHCLRLISVDGYRLAIREEKVDHSTSLSFVIPGKTLSEVLKLLSEKDYLTLFVGRRHIIFNIGKYSVISRLLEGEFLDYKAAIASVYTSEAIINTRLFTESVERVSLLITDRLKSPVCCVFDNDSIKLSCSTSIGHATDEFAIQMNGDRLEMGFNSRYLLDALKNTETDEVKVKLSTPLSPMTIVPVKGESFLFLVLPVQLKT